MACSGVTRDALVAMSGVTRDELVAMSGVRRGVEVAKPQKRSNPTRINNERPAEAQNSVGLLFFSEAKAPAAWRCWPRSAAPMPDVRWTRLQKRGILAAREKASNSLTTGSGCSKKSPGV